MRRSGSRSRAVVAIVAVALLAGACKSSAKTGTSGNTLKIGAALSLTGKFSREGSLTKQGYDYCQNTVNKAGGVPVGNTHYQLAISYQDDKSDPDTAAQLTDQFNDQGLKLILGPYGTPSTSSAAAVVERNSQIVVDSGGADDAIFSHGYSHIFAVLSPASAYVTTMIKAVADLAKPKPKTVAILSADDGFSKTAAAAGKAEAERQGMKVTVEFFPNGTSDVSAALTKIRGAKPDLILGSAHLTEGIALIKQSQELGVNPKGGFGETVAPPTPDFATTLGPQANYVLGSTQWTPQVSGQDKYFGTAATYTAGFTTAFGRAPEYHNAEATAACLALTLAVEKAGSTDATKVRDTLAALDQQSFFGPLKFDSTGKNVTKTMGVIQIQSGKAVTVWPQGPGTKPLLWPTPPFGQR